MNIPIEYACLVRIGAATVVPTPEDIQARQDESCRRLEAAIEAAMKARLRTALDALCHPFVSP